jgi:hypothetical protein
MNYICLKTTNVPTICDLLANISNIEPLLNAVDDERRTPVCLRAYNRIPEDSIIICFVHSLQLHHAVLRSNFSYAEWLINKEVQRDVRSALISG